MPTRRRFLIATGAAGLTATLPRLAHAAPQPRTKAVPATNLRIPVIGMGSWLTFDIGDDAAAQAQRNEVLKTFFAMGGGLIDSSPMYGTSEDVIGRGLAALGQPPGLISATKVWTPGQDHGIRQMEASRRKWGIDRFDVLQIHNLLGWKGHLETLKAWRAEGRVRQIGITTSHGRRHGDLAEIMDREPIDFVQLTYNIADREAEDHLLPLARERGIAVIVNRPFQRGALIDHFQGRPLPPFAADMGAKNWAQVLLKFIVSHPAVTCAIPATTRVDHMKENMGAAFGAMPDEDMRRKLIEYVESL